MYVNEELPFSGIFPFMQDLGLADYNQKHQILAIEKLEALKDELLAAEIKNVDIECTDGNVAQCIVNFTEEKNIDLIAMGTNGARGVSGFLMGSNSFKVANMIDCPILTVHEKSASTPYKILLPHGMILYLHEQNSPSLLI